MRNIYIVDIASEFVTTVQQRFSTERSLTEIPFCGEHPGIAAPPTTRPASAPHFVIPVVTGSSPDRPFTSRATGVHPSLSYTGKSYSDVLRPKTAQPPKSAHQWD